MSRFRPSTLHDILALAQAAAASGANAVASMGRIATALRELPPSDGQLVSRPRFERAGLFSLAALFEDLGPGEERRTTIRVPHDLWIRGIVSGCIPNMNYADQTVQQGIETLEQGVKWTATNWRGLFELSWRLDDVQGFVTSGLPEVEGPANTITGDATWVTPMDWTLQKNQNINVRVRNTSDNLNLIPSAPADATTGVSLRQVQVVFFAVQLSGKGSGIRG